MSEAALTSRTLVFAFFALLTIPEASIAQTQSPYAGQQKREIKSLSQKDIAELARGGGWGFAKVAELNGVPGPLHLLEMKEQIALTAKQVEQITILYRDMKQEAITLGRQYVQLERELDRDFRTGSIDEAKLKLQLDRVAKVRAQLRGVHLLAHLKARPLLSDLQVQTYNRLRGYGVSNPCASPPKGHNVAMWRKHHGCE